MIKYHFLFLFFCAVHIYGMGQQLPHLPQIKLKKLSQLSENKARIIRYYRMMRRDSVRRERIQKRLLKNLVDSTVRANRNAVFGSLDSSTIKKGMSQYSPDSMLNQFQPPEVLAKFDSTYIGSVAKANDLIGMADLKAPFPDSNFPLEGVQRDSLSQRVHSTAMEQLQTKIPSEILDGEKIPKSVSSAFGSISEDIQNKAASTLSNNAVDFIANHQHALLGAQQQIRKLLQRYREFSNSNSLEGAKKRNSLSDKSFSERLVFNAITNVANVSPFSMDLTALAGYRIARPFSTGVGINVRFSGSDSIPSTHYISNRHLGFKAFISYDIPNSFFLYGEWERVEVRTRMKEDGAKSGVNNVMVGLGRKFLVHPKLYMTLIAMYNLNPDEENPTHPNRFQIRSGFQLSELAMRRKNINYDPNR